MSDLPHCVCDDFWPGQHHPDCPVRKRIEELEALIDRYEKEVFEPMQGYSDELMNLLGGEDETFQAFNTIRHKAIQLLMDMRKAREK